MHNLVVSSLAVAYLGANTYAIVKVGVFELARSRKHLLLYGVPFILRGSVIQAATWHSKSPDRTCSRWGCSRHAPSVRTLRLRLR